MRSSCRLSLSRNCGEPLFSLGCASKEIIQRPANALSADHEAWSRRPLTGLATAVPFRFANCDCTSLLPERTSRHRRLRPTCYRWLLIRWVFLTA